MAHTRNSARARLFPASPPLPPLICRAPLDAPQDICFGWQAWLCHFHANRRLSITHIFSKLSAIWLVITQLIISAKL